MCCCVCVHMCTHVHGREAAMAHATAVLKVFTRPSPAALCSWCHLWIW